MHEAFLLVFLDSASNIRQQLDSYESQSAEGRLDEGALAVLWAALTSTDKDGLEFLSRMMRKLVLPALEDTRELSARTMDTVGFEASQGQKNEGSDGRIDGGNKGKMMRQTYQNNQMGCPTCLRRVYPLLRSIIDCRRRRPLYQIHIRKLNGTGSVLSAGYLAPSAGPPRLRLLMTVSKTCCR